MSTAYSGMALMSPGKLRLILAAITTGSFSAADGASVKGEVWVEPPGTRAAGGPLAS